MTRRPAREAGFTLIEVIVALVLFALITVAGMALVESVLKIQHRTAGRLERLGDMQRAMFVLANDLGQIGGGPVSGGGAIRFSRPFAATAGPPQPIVYRVADGSLVRAVGTRAGQPLLAGVATTRWRFYQSGVGWIDRWPPDARRNGEWPAAISVEILLAPAPDRPGGTLRRVVALPSQP